MRNLLVVRVDAEKDRIFLRGAVPGWRDGVVLVRHARQAPRAAAPFLIMHGTSDPTVGFVNGLAFYNALRYNGKKAVLLA